MDSEELLKLSNIIIDLKKKVKCSVCYDYVQDVVETECGHLFCRECFGKQTVLCPVCKAVISRRRSIYKDEFLNSLSRFVNETCQLIKEKYTYDVEEIEKVNSNQLEKIIETAPNNIYIIPSDDDIPRNKKEPVEDAFDKLISNKRKCYTNKNKLSTREEILDFDNCETRSKVVNWLKENKQKLDILTQNKSELKSNDHFEIPSVSQVGRKVVKNNRSKGRTQSLSIADEAEDKILRRYQSLSQSLGDIDNYNIEEVQSEELMKQVERKVLQDMLEDQCLVNLENIAKQTEVAKNIFNKDKKAQTTKNVSPNFSNAGSASGWDRIGNDINSSIKDNKGKRPLRKSTAKSNAKNRKWPVEEKENPIHIIEGNAKQKDQKERHTHNRTKSNSNNIDKCTKENMVNHQKSRAKQCLVIEDCNQDISEQNGDKNVCNLEEDLNDDIFSMATQKTSNDSNIIDNIYVVPVSKHMTNITTIAIALSDNLDNCMKHVKNFDGDSLLHCFSNLKTYVDKIQQLKIEQNNEKAVQTSRIDGVIKCDAYTQTNKFSYLNKTVQTRVVQMHSMGLQTSCSLKHVETQTEENKTNEDIDNLIIGSSEEKMDVEESIKPIDNNMEEFTTVNTSKSNNVNVTNEANMAYNSPKTFSKIDSSQHQHSLNSLLVCTLNSAKSKKSQRQVNKKLFEDMSSSRKFKRIREVNPDSDSDDGTNPSKRKFVKDDLTVEFLDTENVKESDDLVTEDDDNIDYDKYLKEVMEKYGSPTKNIKTCAAKTPEKQPENCTKSALQKSQKRKIDTQQFSSGNGIFTGNTQFEENMDKIEKEIHQYEELQKSVNTESDLILGTPTVLHDSKKLKLLNFKSKGTKAVSEEAIETTSTGCVLSKKSAGDKKVLNTKRSQHGTSTQDALNILEELKNDDSFFDENEENNLQSEVTIKNRGSLKTGIESHNKSGKMSATSHDIDEILADLERDDDKEVEAELENISFTAEARKLEKREQNGDKISILQDIKIQDKVKNKTEQIGIDIIDSSGESDDDICETTPQKEKKRPSFNRSSNVDEIIQINDTTIEPLDICLPPPPGFEDDGRSKSTSPSQREFAVDASLTPDQLFLEDQITAQLDEIQPSGIIKSAKHKNKLLSQEIKEKFGNLAAEIIDDEMFSPIAKPTMNIRNVRLSSNTPLVNTPLVNTPRLTNKKPSILTSTPNQKSILNYLKQTESKSPTKKSKPCIMFSRIQNKELKNVFKQLEMRKMISVSGSFQSQVTHLIVAVDEMGRLKGHTAKFLLAVAAGIWVVRYDWAIECLKANKNVPEDPYEALDVSGIPGPQKSRLTRNSNPLFQEYSFFNAPPFTTLSVKDVEDVVRMLDGEIVDKLEDLTNDNGRIKLIITDSSATEEVEKFDDWLDNFKTATVDIEWFIKCVAEYQIISFRPFLMCSDEKIFDLNYPQALTQSVPFSFTETCGETM